MTTNKTLAIFGFGGHSKVIKDIAYLNGYNSYVYYDDYQTNEKIVGKSNDLIKHKNEISDLFIAIGDNNLRKKKFLEFNKYFNMISLIHPRSIISANSKEIGSGSVVMAGVIINSSVKIGNCTIVNTGSIVDHETIIDDYVHISPGVTIGGQVKIGANSWLGIGSTVINNITINNNVLLGAHSLLTKDADKNSKYIGVPAKKVDEY